MFVVVWSFSILILLIYSLCLYLYDASYYYLLLILEEEGVQYMCICRITVYLKKNSVSQTNSNETKKTIFQTKKKLTMSESIYDWIERDPEKIVKPPMYHSRHSPKSRLTGSTMRKERGSHGTFGKDSTKSDPQTFLRSKKNRGVSPKSKRTFLSSVYLSLLYFFFQRKVYSFTIHVFTASKFTRNLVKSPKPAVPKRDDKPVMGLKTTKNFVVSNAVENILSSKSFFSIYCYIYRLHLPLCVLTRTPKTNSSPPKDHSHCQTRYDW